MCSADYDFHDFPCFNAVRARIMSCSGCTADANLTQGGCGGKDETNNASMCMIARRAAPAQQIGRQGSRIHQIPQPVSEGLSVIGSQESNASASWVFAAQATTHKALVRTFPRPLPARPAGEAVRQLTSGRKRS